MRKEKIWTKISGAGNSFWFYYCLSPKEKAPVKNSWSKTAIAVCQQKTKSLSANGLVILLPSKKADFKWIFRNADGSSAEMCGNAACCAISYILKKKLLPSHKKTFFLETKKQILKAGLYKKQPVVFLNPLTRIKGPFEVIWKKQKVSYMFIDSGVPHAVIELKKSLKKTKDWHNKKALAKFLRRNRKHNKKGMNVSFYYKKKEAQLFAKSFERGVEDFTSACGTGALAVAQVYQWQNRKCLKNIFIQMPGGILEIKQHYDKSYGLISPVKWQREVEETCLLIR